MGHHPLTAIRTIYQIMLVLVRTERQLNREIPLRYETVNLAEGQVIQERAMPARVWNSTAAFEMEV